MQRHAPETQTLYAQLFESVVAHAAQLVGGFGNGLLVERVVRKRHYLYWQVRSLAGQLRQVYLGPSDDDDAARIGKQLADHKAGGSAALADLQRLTAAYLASGGVI